MKNAPVIVSQGRFHSLIPGRAGYCHCLSFCGKARFFRSFQAGRAVPPSRSAFVNGNTL